MTIMMGILLITALTIVSYKPPFTKPTFKVGAIKLIALINTVYFSFYLFDNNAKIKSMI